MPREHSIDSWKFHLMHQPEVCIPPSLYTQILHLQCGKFFIMFNIFICFTNQLDSCQHRYSARPFLSETVRCRNDFTSESRKDDVNKIVVEYQGQGWRQKMA